MSTAVILAVGLDSSLLAEQRRLPECAGYVFVAAGSIREAIDHFRTGDFDLVLLGDSLSLEDQERLTFLIRTNGTNTPVICIGNRCGDRDLFADVTLARDSSSLLADVGELLADRAKAQRSAVFRRQAN